VAASPPPSVAPADERDPRRLAMLAAGFALFVVIVRRVLR